MLTTVELTLDCADAPALAEFWKLAAGYVHHPPPYATMQEWQAHQARLQTSPKGGGWALRAFAPLLHGPPPGGHGRSVPGTPCALCPTLLVDGYVAGVWRSVDGGIEATAFHRLCGEAWPGGRGPGAGGIPG